MSRTIRLMGYTISLNKKKDRWEARQKRKLVKHNTEWITLMKEIGFKSNYIDYGKSSNIRNKNNRAGTGENDK